jgi:hypothetical protein
MNNLIDKSEKIKMKYMLLLCAMIFLSKKNVLLGAKNGMNAQQ